MKRAWSHALDHPGTGARFAQAIGCISTEPFVSSLLDLHHLVLTGAEVRITAERVKLDAVTGEPLEDHTQPGDYITSSYVFEPNIDAPDAGWFVQREPNEEGEQAAADYATALGMKADRGFCEAMVQMKCSLDRFGGRCYIKPVIHEQRVMGIAYEYQHLVKEDPPRTPPAEPSPQPEESEAATTDSELERSGDQGQDEADSPDTPSEDHTEADREVLEAIEARA